MVQHEGYLHSLELGFDVVRCATKFTLASEKKKKKKITLPAEEEMGPPGRSRMFAAFPGARTWDVFHILSKRAEGRSTSGQIN